MHGIEWIVEAQGCRPGALREESVLQSLFAAIVQDLDLHPVGETRWHQFPGNGGITGLCLLSESHLAVHTFPEHQSLCLNLFCCRPRPDWNFENELQNRLGAVQVRVRKILRPYASGEEQLVSTSHTAEAEQ